ncbi:hypothetical protein MMC11_007839 [Xylographa trunciseda]|nr:hypothetical protein [Xylographa trunciseda]
MPPLKASIRLGAILLGTRVVAHGIVTGVVSGGTYYQGYSPSFQFANPIPQVAGWSSPEDLSLGFIDPSNYTAPDIICHLGSIPGATYATVAAGGTVVLQWSVWPSSHHGPVIDYLANCNGDCTGVDKTTLLFNKIDGVGLISDTTAPGVWASDQLISANNSWTVTIPATIAPGSYVLRHEIIALHSAENANGAQNYPQCVNLKVTGTGTDSLPSGTLGTSLYTPTDPGILFNIYTTPLSYSVPGPALLVGNAQATSAAASQTPAPFANATSTLVASAVASAVASPSSLTATPSTSASAVATPVGSSTTATEAVFASLTSASPTTYTAVASSLSVPGSMSSTAASPADSLPSACPNSALTTIQKKASTLNTDASPPDTPLPSGLTLNEFFAWLQGVAANMFRDGQGPSVKHARAVRL